MGRCKYHDTHFNACARYSTFGGKFQHLVPCHKCELFEPITNYDRFKAMNLEQIVKAMIEANAKAEVAREICCKIEEEIVAALESNYRARKEHIERYAELAYDTELLLEINGKINALRGIEGFVEELKKEIHGGREMILDDMWMPYGRIPHPEEKREAPHRCGLTRQQWEKKKRERKNRKKARKKK